MVYSSVSPSNVGGDLFPDFQRNINAWKGEDKVFHQTCLQSYSKVHKDTAGTWIHHPKDQSRFYCSRNFPFNLIHV